MYVMTFSFVRVELSVACLFNIFAQAFVFKQLFLKYIRRFFRRFKVQKYETLGKDAREKWMVVNKTSIAMSFPPRELWRRTIFSSSN